MPASYPAAVKTFTAKNTGDTVEATHITDLQDEVTAIEGGIRNGTAPLNSSNSTVANLVVTGNAQVGANVNAATLGVTGVSTFTGAAAFGGAVTFATTVGLAGTMAITALSTGNTDNLAIASTLSIIQVGGNSSGSTLTGLAWSGGASQGLTVQLWNVSGQSVVLGHATGSVSSGQFRCPGNTALTVRANGAVWLTYDASIPMWRVIAP